MRANPIFVDNFPEVGQVPMMFYLPHSSEKNDLTQIIQKHGGLVTEIHECFTYQIAPLNEEVQPSLYFFGEVYRAHWIADSVREGRLLDKDEYLQFKNEAKNSKRITFQGSRVEYTITETLKIFELALANISSARGSTFWQEVERNGILPTRTAESMRNHWKTNERKGLGEYLRYAINSKTKFCHALSYTPTVRVYNVSANVEERILENAKNSATIIQQEKNGATSYKKSTFGEGSQKLESIFSTMEKIRPQQDSFHQINVMGNNDILGQLSKQNLTVRDDQGNEVNVQDDQQALFALIAQDMQKLAVQYKKDIHELHMLYYQVSCSRENLIKLLEGSESRQFQWNQLEDLALKERDRNTPSYLHVLKNKGADQCEIRRRFLELE